MGSPGLPSRAVSFALAHFELSLEGPERFGAGRITASISRRASSRTSLPLQPVLRSKIAPRYNPRAARSASCRVSAPCRYLALNTTLHKKSLHQFYIILVEYGQNSLFRNSVREKPVCIQFLCCYLPDISPEIQHHIRWWYPLPPRSR